MSQTTVAQDPKAPATPELSQKSFFAAWLFAWLLGTFGADRFYPGKIGTAVARGLVSRPGLGDRERS